MRRLFVVFTLAAVLGLPSLASAAPLDDKIQLLHARPTGMEEAEWRRQRREVARELGESRNEKAIDALIEVAETERYDSVLTIAIQGLGKQGDPRALPALQRVYADRSLDTFVREEAGKSIQALGGTPRDDARLTGELSGGTTGSGDEGLVQGPQLGTMGAASAPDEDLPPPKRQRELPENLRGRERALGFAVGAADVTINTADPSFPLGFDADLAAQALYVDDRQGWGWSAHGVLSGSYATGDYVATGDPDDGVDVGNATYFRQALAGAAEVHYYPKETNWHGFIGLGVSERFTVAKVDHDGDTTDENEADYRDNRFALDIAPNAGFGWGRYLNAGGDLMVDAIVSALQTENILARPVDQAGREAIQSAVFDYANDYASYPRMAAALNVLKQRGYLARSPSPRLIYRLIRIMDDPSYVTRMEGPRIRLGFAFGLPLAQGSYLGRNTDGSIAGPFMQFDYGIQLDKEREFQIDTRVFYDAIDFTGYTTDSGAIYRRNFHGKYEDYLGTWYLGVRGGVSQRNIESQPNAVTGSAPGYLLMGLAGYSYGFNRGSRIDAGATAGMNSGAFVAGIGLGFTFGIAHAAVLNGPSREVVGQSRRSKKRGGASSDAKAGANPKAGGKANASGEAKAGKK
jgi:hypothetical protein